MQISTGDLSGGGRLPEDRILVNAESTLAVALDGVSTLTDDAPVAAGTPRRSARPSSPCTIEPSTSTCATRST